MEEWRAVLVDATVMGIINGNEISKDDFVKNLDEPGCYLNKNGVGILIKKLEKKFQISGLCGLSGQFQTCNDVTDESVGKSDRV